MRLEQGDCLEVMRAMAGERVKVDSIVTDPPYGLGFMGKHWDHGVPGVAYWRAAYALLPPGGHLLAFSGTRTYHRMACAIEDAGFEIRDQLQWLYGSGFPKSRDVSKAIDAELGHDRKSDYVPNFKNGTHGHGWGGGITTETEPPATEAAREWQGWGTALKPACEPIVLARKPLDGTVAANVQKHGTGALNVDGCRVQGSEARDQGSGRDGEASADRRYTANGATSFSLTPEPRGGAEDGRWPANVVHDGSPEVLEAFAAFGEKTSGRIDPHHKMSGSGDGYRHGERSGADRPGDTGTAARFFYTAKADKTDRWGSKHPTVKPVSLIRWLVRLITPPGGTVLDPFAGSGTCGVACIAEGFDAILIEREAEYMADIRERVAFYQGEGRHSLASKGRKAEKPCGSDLPLFR